MRTFAPKPKAPQQTAPAQSAAIGQALFGQSREMNLIFHLQRTFGNQAVQRLLEANSGEFARSATTAATAQAGDTSRQDKPGPPPLAHPLAKLQRAIANRAVLHLPSLARPSMQAKLMVSEPGDPYEVEADSVAEQVVRMSDPDSHTSVRTAESADGVDAHANTAGRGQYGTIPAAGAKLIAHELTQPGRDALLSSDLVPNFVAPSISRLRSTSPLQRKPPTTQVTIEATGSNAVVQLPQGAGSSGAVIYEYTAVATGKPPDVNDVSKSGGQFDINLPLLIYPPSHLSYPPSADPSKPGPIKVDIFLFFHGFRATYEEGTTEQQSQGWEPIALWTHLKDAVAAADRPDAPLLGIAPQGPKTWVKDKTGTNWIEVYAQWNEALSKVHFDGLIQIALDRLRKDLGLSAPLRAGHIHVAGHSAGGKGIIEATSLSAGAKTFGPLIQDVTLQDAGYAFGHWDHLMDWFLEGTPGKTIRVLISQSQQSDTRAILSLFNVDNINSNIKAKKKSATLEAVAIAVPKPEDQKPRPGGFVLESQLVVNNKQAGSPQGTMVVFFAPRGGHYETSTASMEAAAAAGPQVTADFLGEAKPGKYRVISAKATLFKDKDLDKDIESLERNAPVDVTTLELKRPAGRRDKAIQPYIAHVKTADGVEGWMLLANLAPTT